MAARFGARCFCCGVSAAEEANCVACEAPRARFPPIEPVLYGEPMAVVVEVLVRMARGELTAAQEIVAAWRTGGAEGFEASQLAGITAITGAAVDEAAPPGVALRVANAAVKQWLLDGQNSHPPATFAHLYERVFVEQVFDDPCNLSYLGLLESTGIRAHNRELSQKPSEEDSKRELGFCQKNLQLLDGLVARQEDGKVPAAESINVSILRYVLNRKINGYQWRHHGYAVEQLRGPQAQLVMLFASLTPVRSLEDAWNYAQRLTEIPKYLGFIRAELQAQKSLGIAPPIFALETVVKTTEGVLQGIEADPKKTPFYSSLMGRLEKALSDGERDNNDIPEELKTAVRNAISTQAKQGFEELLADVRDLLEFAKADGERGQKAGVAALPDGPDFYKNELEAQTSSQLTPQQVHDLGLEWVARHEEGMRATVNKIAETDKSIDPSAELSVILKKFAKDERFLYPKTQEGRDMVIRDYKQIAADILKVTDSMFDIMPEAVMNIEPVPAHMEASAPPAFFMPPSLDGSRAGVFYANLGNMDSQQKWMMKCIGVHEGVPGHHFQISLKFEAEGMPKFRMSESFMGFCEGWGLYTEQLAKEVDFYDDYDTIGFYTCNIWRSSRLVVDTGLHYLGWSRQRAVEYMMTHCANLDEETATREVDRYCVMPGQACTYTVGALEILKLRDDLQRELGDKFDVRAFHRALLTAGDIPLSMLPEVTAGLVGK